jgi:hypothetical protein
MLWMKTGSGDWDVRYSAHSGLKSDIARSPEWANKQTHAPQQVVSLTRLSRLISISQRAAKAIPLISATDRAETSGTDRADCDGTRFAGPPF